MRQIQTQISAKRPVYEAVEDNKSCKGKYSDDHRCCRGNLMRLMLMMTIMMIVFSMLMIMIMMMVISMLMIMIMMMVMIMAIDLKILLTKNIFCTKRDKFCKPRVFQIDRQEMECLLSVYIIALPIILQNTLQG